MLKVVKRVQVNKDLIQFCMEDDKQPSKEFYAYTNGNGAFKSVAIINNDNNTRREYKSYRFTKKYFDVVSEWVKVERKKREFEQRKKVDELTYREILDKVRNIIVYGVEENIEQAIRLSYGLDYFNGFEDEYNQYLNEENEEKKETLEKKLMRDVVGPNVGVKASGGVRTTEDAVKVIEAGASRIGASASIAIATGVKGNTEGY